ncbi:MAG: hypothetical protein Q9226_001981 [Calogaya cf. arnoldii]
MDRFWLGHNKLWTSQLRAKYYGKGQKWERADFDKITHGFDAIIDSPCNFFTEEFMTAYPSALVILNIRPFDSWYKSMTSTIWACQSWPSWRLLQYTEPRVVGVYYRLLRLEWEIFCGHVYSTSRIREAYEERHNHIRAVVPKERLLEYPLGAGWGPICEFLGKSVPEGLEFPHVNDKEKWLGRVGKLWWYGVKQTCVNAMKVGVPLAACAAAVTWMYHK